MPLWLWKLLRGSIVPRKFVLTLARDCHQHCIFKSLIRAVKPSIHLLTQSAKVSPNSRGSTFHLSVDALIIWFCFCLRLACLPFHHRPITDHGTIWPRLTTQHLSTFPTNGYVWRGRFRHFPCVSLCTPNETRTRISTLRGWPPQPISKMGAYVAEHP